MSFDFNTLVKQLREKNNELNKILKITEEARQYWEQESKTKDEQIQQISGDLVLKLSELQQLRSIRKEVEQKTEEIAAKTKQINDLQTNLIQVLEGHI